MDGKIERDKDRERERKNREGGVGEIERASLSDRPHLLASFIHTMHTIA